MFTASAARALGRQDGAHRQEPFSQVAPLLAAAVVLGVAGGFALATALTVSRALSMPEGVWWPAAAQAHGHLQVYGWVGLFILGVLMHFLPRLRGAPLAFPGAVRWLAGALVAGLALRALSQPALAMTGAGLARWALATSGAVEGIGLLGLVVVIVATLIRGPALATRQGLRGVLPLLTLAVAALAMAAAVNVANVITAAGGIGLVPGVGDTLNVTLGLFGFLTPVALAMSAQSLPMYAGLQPFPRKVLWPLAGVYAAGLCLLCAGPLGLIEEATSFTHAAGMTLIGGALAAFVGVFLALMRKRGRLPAKVERLAPAPNAAAASYRSHVASQKAAYGPFVALVASAYVWAALAAVLMLVDGVVGLFSGGVPVSEDVVRHSLAIGFLALLLCGIAPRMVPGFSGGRIRSPSLVTATLWLGNGAAILRVGSLLVEPLLARGNTGGQVLASAAFGLSGPLGLGLAFCLAINLWPAIWGRSAS